MDCCSGEEKKRTVENGCSIAIRPVVSIGTNSVFELLHRQITQKIFSYVSKSRGIAGV